MVLQSFSKYSSAIYMGSLSGSRTHGSGFDFTEITNAGFGRGGNADQLYLTRKGRYLVLVNATVTNNSTTNNQNTGFIISATEAVNRSASRPGTDASVSISLAGSSYADAPEDADQDSFGSVVLQVLAHGTIGNTITIVSGHIIVMKINGEVNGEVEV